MNQHSIATHAIPDSTHYQEFTSPVSKYQQALITVFIAYQSF